MRKPSSVETMAAIVREEPPAIEEKLPAPLKWILDPCLAKEPDRRYESTRDLYRDLVNLRNHFSEAYTSATFAPVTTPAVKSPRWKFLAICAGCISLGALLVYILKPSGQDVGNFRYTPIASDAALPASNCSTASANSNSHSDLYISKIKLRLKSGMLCLPLKNIASS